VLLDLEFAASIRFVRADRESLRAAIVNLGTNAIEAAGLGGEVTLKTVDSQDNVGIEVGDSGKGPPPHVAETLFEPFVSTKPEGVGLGLALARQVALDHGGSLSWKREAGRTIFRLTLPAERHPVTPTDSVVHFDNPKSEIQNPKSEITQSREALPTAAPGP
jgi:hypothetical protein